MYSIKILALNYSVVKISTKPCKQNFTGQLGQWIADFTGLAAKTTGHGPPDQCKFRPLMCSRLNSLSGLISIIGYLSTMN